MGAMSSKLTRAEEGDTVAFARLEDLATGDRIADGRTAPAPGATPAAPPATQGIAIRVKDRKDEVRLASALAKLCEEDRALSYVQDAEMSELKLFGQGEMHLRVTAERLADRFGVTIQCAEAVRRLSGIDSRRRHGARTAQKTVGRAWPIWRRRGRGRPARPRRGLRLRRARAWRIGAEAVFFFRGSRRARRDGARAARISGGRRLGDPDRRLLSYRRFLRHGVSRGGEARPRRGPGQSAPDAARTDPLGDRLRADRRARARERAGQRAARSDPRLRGPGGLGGLGGAAGADPGGRNRRSHCRIALGDRGRRRVRDQIRPFGRAFRARAPIWWSPRVRRRTPKVSSSVGRVSRCTEARPSPKRAARL